MVGNGLRRRVDALEQAGGADLLRPAHLIIRRHGESEAEAISRYERQHRTIQEDDLTVFLTGVAPVAFHANGDVR